MLANLLYTLWPYQIFKSVFFRGGVAFLTTYALIVVFMPPLIRRFRRLGLASDFAPVSAAGRPYAGAKPIMGGVLLLLGIAVSMLLWMEWNQFMFALILIMLAFGGIGAWDDLAKIAQRRRIELGLEEKKSYSNKADGASGTIRLAAEFLVATVVVVALYRYITIDGHLVVPGIPLKWWYPYLPRYVFVPFMIIVIVGGANAVNLTDGMDSLATVPILTCTLFVAAVAFVGSDPELAARLKLPVLPNALKELVVVGFAILSAGFAFLRFNAPPAMITLGDMGALALGATISTMFIFAKVELFLPLVGGVFVLTTVSTVLQRAFFKWMLWWKGRDVATRIRFFYRAPYHHHLQTLWHYTDQKREIVSVWAEALKKLGINSPSTEDQLIRTEDVNSRVIWRVHMISIWLVVTALVVYFKVR
jgi:phospho-N-acetylmuramoyl-pentapeptide-transferase